MIRNRRNERDDAEETPYNSGNCYLCVQHLLTNYDRRGRLEELIQGEMTYGAKYNVHEST